jgi:diacylglycerol kinase family enzyme
VRGIVRYLLATLIGVMRNPHWTITLEWEDGEYQGPASLVTVGNNPLTGGLFYMTPHATPFDGLLTFTYGYLASRLQILAVLPKTMKPAAGSYVEHPAIREYNTTWLRIHADPSTPLHTDGEIQSESVTDLDYRIHPQYFPILFP